MHTIVAAVALASLTLYQAQVPTFGCNSTAEVSKLQTVRSDAQAFQRLLTAQVAYGQCVTIPKGALVEGPIPDPGSSVLLINVKDDPPGYVVPLKDFKPKMSR